MTKLRISTSLNLHEGSRENIPEYITKGLSFHKKIGFDAVDMPSPLFKGMGEKWEEGIAHALRESEKAGIRFELCHLPFGIKPDAPQEEQEAFRASVHTAIDAAKMLGVSYAVLHPNSVTIPMSEYDEKAQHEMVMAHLSPFAEHAAKLGVKLVVENMPVVPGARVTHRFSQSAEEICQVADAFGMGICWDFGHANVSGVHQSEAITYIGDRLKMVHVHDNCAMADEHNMPFTGNVDWQDAMHGLALVSFDGVFDLELSPARFPAPLRKSHARLALETAQYLMTYLK